MRDNLGFDFLSSNAITLLSDPVLLVDVLYILVDLQAEKHRLDPVAFGKLYKGNSKLFNDALLSCWVSFSPRQPKAEKQPQKDTAPATPDTDPWEIVYQMAGYLGMDPKPHTYRELVDMFRGKQKIEDNTNWEQTSLIAHLTARAAGAKRSSKQSDYLPKRLQPKRKEFWEF